MDHEAMPKRSRVTAITVALSGTWSASALCESYAGSDPCRSTLTTYRHYADAAAFAAEHPDLDIRPGTPVYRFDKASRADAIQHAYCGAMPDDKLPPGSCQTIFGQVETWTPGTKLGGLDNVARDVHVRLSREAGIPIETV